MSNQNQQPNNNCQPIDNNEVNNCQPADEWREKLEKMLPKLSERSWGKIASQISQAEQRGYERGCDEDNSDEILWKRMKEWNKEWQDENPKERSLTWQDALKLIEWKIEKAEQRGKREGLEMGKKIAVREIGQHTSPHFSGDCEWGNCELCRTVKAIDQAINQLK